jgi:hypothetical protein
MITSYDMTDVINELNAYMLTCKNISTFTRYIDKTVKIPEKKVFKTETANKSIFIPYQEDKLFWIYYFVKYGYVEYNMVGSNSYSIETSEKLRLISEIKAHKAIFKEYKLNKISDSANEILSSPVISFKSFELICIANKISFVMIKHNMYHKIIFDDAEDIYIIHIVNSMYGCEKIKLEDLKNYEINRYKIDNYDKPIACAGSFKINELVDIANNLNVELNDERGKKLSKQSLYNFVYSKINNFFDK